MEKTLPVHVRATRVIRKRHSLIFGKTYFSYDVRFRDGRVQQDRISMRYYRVPDTQLITIR